MKEQILLRVVTKLMIPFIMILGLYVITHGELGPGGGFQGGVIMASAFILYGIVFGPTHLQRILPQWLTTVLSSLGVLAYAGAGVYCMLAGYAFLDYTPLASKPASAETWGMTIVEYGVGITVASVMITIFKELSEGPVPVVKGAKTTRRTRV